VADVPHFSLPFRFVNPQAATTEQDSLDEVADCVFAILTCPVGFRVESPSFGLPDPTFSMPAPDLDEIRSVIEQWDDRAAVVLAEQPDLFDALIAHVIATVSVRSEA
jgi:hypothetical protein